MINLRAIEEFEVDYGWTTQKMLLAFKSLDGILYLDARKWTLTPSGWRPKAGIMLKVADWPKSIAKIAEVIGNGSCNMPLSIDVK